MHYSCENETKIVKITHSAAPWPLWYMKLLFFVQFFKILLKTHHIHMGHPVQCIFTRYLGVNTIQQAEFLFEFCMRIRANPITVIISFIVFALYVIFTILVSFLLDNALFPSEAKINIVWKNFQWRVPRVYKNFKQGWF